MIKPCEMTEHDIIIRLGAKLTGQHTKKKGFQLTFKQVVALFRKTEVCFYTKEPFENAKDISFERLNPLLGYIHGNVVLVKSDINLFKGNSIDNFVCNSRMSFDSQGELLIRIGRFLKAKAKADKEHQEAASYRMSSLVEQAALMQEKKRTRFVSKDAS